MITIRQFREMPHVYISPDTSVDLELELHMHDTSKEFLDYIYGILIGRTFITNNNQKIKLSPTEIKTFAKYILENDTIKSIIKKKFDVDVYGDFIILVSKFV